MILATDLPVKRNVKEVLPILQKRLTKYHRVLHILLISHNPKYFMFCLSIPFTLKKLPLLSTQQLLIVKDDIFPEKTPL